MTIYKIPPNKILHLLKLYQWCTAVSLLHNVSSFKIITTDTILQTKVLIIWPRKEHHPFTLQKTLPPRREAAWVLGRLLPPLVRLLPAILPHISPLVHRIWTKPCRAWIVFNGSYHEPMVSHDSLPIYTLVLSATIFFQWLYMVKLAARHRHPKAQPV